MEVFVGTFVHSTDDSPMIILTDMVMGVLNTKVGSLSYSVFRFLVQTISVGLPVFQSLCDYL